MKPRVSIIVPVYNGARFLPGAVRSLLDQSFTDFELIIVNDGSLDNTLEVAKSFSADTRVSILNLPSNRGVSAARNSGIENSSGELVAFFDHDDLALKDMLRIQVGILEAYPEAALVNADVAFIDENGIIFDKFKNMPASRFANPNGKLIVSNQINELFESCYIHSNTVMVRRRALEKVGLFDEALRYAEDYNLWLRMAHYFQVAHIATIVTYYRQHGVQATINKNALLLGKFRALEAYMKACPDYKEKINPSVRRNRMGRVHASLAGHFFWNEQDYRSARRHYLKSWKCGVWNQESLVRFAYCWLPHSIRALVRKGRHRIRGGSS